MRRGLAIERRSRSDRRRPRSSTNVGTSIAARHWAEMVLDWNHCMGHPVGQPIPSSASARGALCEGVLDSRVAGHTKETGYSSRRGGQSCRWQAKLAGTDPCSLVVWSNQPVVLASCWIGFAHGAEADPRWAPPFRRVWINCTLVYRFC